MHLAASFILALMLAGCVDQSEIADVKAFVRDSEKGMPRRIEPLPPFPPKGEPAKYGAASLPDPFNPRGAAGGRARK